MRQSLAQFRLFALIFLVLWVFVACGGNDDDARIRLVNATVGAGALDFYTGDDKRGSGVAADTASDYASVDEGTYDVKVKKSGSDTALLSNSITYSKDKHYSIVAWGRDGSVRLASLSEESDAPSSGLAKVRLFNAATDVGSVDLYLTASATTLDSATTSAAAITVGSVSNYSEMGKGTYRLRIVGTGNVDDVRLDLPSLTLGDKERVTVILQPSSGGVLAHALLLVEQGAVSAFKNTSARARVVASVSGNGVVAVKAGSTFLSGSLTSPAVGSYVLVPSGSQTLLAQVNGATVSSANTDLSSGADYTVLVYGGTTLGQVLTIADDNRLPTTSTKAKLRLVHGAEGYSTLSLTLDSGAVATEVPYGTTSNFALVNTSNGNALVEVASPLSNTPLYTTARSSGSTGVSIEAQGVYTVFMLGGNASPRGVLRKER